MKGTKRKINFGLPGHTMSARIEEWFEKAGYVTHIDGPSASASIDDPDVNCFVGATVEIASLVSKGLLDGGIISTVALEEAGADVDIVADLGTLKPEWPQTKLVLAVPKDSDITTLQGLKGKKIITRVPNIAERFLKKNKISAAIEHSRGSNETKVPAFADALVEFSNTGYSLEAHGLTPIATLMEDSVIVIAHKTKTKSSTEKHVREKINTITLLLEGARHAEGMVVIMFHVSGDNIEQLLHFLPALKKPTITPLRGENNFDVLSVVSKKELRTLIPKMRDIHCTDIVELPLNKIIQ